jgi:hypothetical protein
MPNLIERHENDLYLVADYCVRNSSLGCIGFVLVNEEAPRDCFIAYMGICKTGSIRNDAQDIAANGYKMTFDEAKPFFPGILRKEYKKS